MLTGKLDKLGVFDEALSRLDLTAYHVEIFADTITGRKKGEEANKAPKPESTLARLMLEGPSIINSAVERIDKAIAELRETIL